MRRSAVLIALNKNTCCIAFSRLHRGCSVNQTASRVRLLYARDVFRSSEAAAVALEEMRVNARRVQLGLDAPQAHRRMTRPEQHT